MTLNANALPKTGNGKTFEPVPQGTYPARLVGVLDLGLQAQKAYKGKEKPPRHEIMLTYELTTEFMKDDDGKDMEDKPRWISETMGFYPLDVERAKCTKRYLSLDPDKKFEGDFSKLVDTPCIITVVHNKNMLSQKTYANVSNVALPMKGMEIAPLKNSPRVLDRSNPDMEVWEALPDWIKDKIKGCLDFQGTQLGKALEGAKNFTTPPPAQEEAPAVEDNPY